RLGERTDENLEQLSVDLLFASIAHGGILDVYCSVVSLLPPAASSSSARATSTSARHFKSAASSSACFSSGPYGHITHSALMRSSLEARWIAAQSASSLLASR